MPCLSFFFLFRFILLVFELCERGVLTEVTIGDKIGKIFEDDECRKVFIQMLLGIEYRKCLFSSLSFVVHVHARC